MILSQNKSDIKNIGLLSFAIQSLFFVLVSVGAITVVAILSEANSLSYSTFKTTFFFFFFQKALLFFMAHAGVALWMHSLLQTIKINAQWVAIDALKQESKKVNPPKITVKVGGLIKPLNINDICWIQADDYCVKVHTENKSYYLRKSLKFLEKELKPHRFVRIHRGALLNLNYLDQVNFNASLVTLQNSTEIPISKSGQALLKEEMKASVA